LKLSPIGPQHVSAGNAAIRVKYVTLNARELLQLPLHAACMQLVPSHAVSFFQL
jgi:hypothetical protein